MKPAYFAAQIAYHTIAAAAEDAHASLSAMERHTSAAHREWSTGYRKHQAEWHRLMAQHYAECAAGLDPEYPEQPEYPDFEELGEGADSSCATAP